MHLGPKMGSKMGIEKVGLNIVIENGDPKLMPKMWYKNDGLKWGRSL